MNGSLAMTDSMCAVQGMHWERLATTTPQTSSLLQTVSYHQHRILCIMKLYDISELGSSARCQNFTLFSCYKSIQYLRASQSFSTCQLQ